MFAYSGCSDYLFRRREDEGVRKLHGGDPGVPQRAGHFQRGAGLQGRHPKLHRARRCNGQQEEAGEEEEEQREAESQPGADLGRVGV